MPDAAMTTVAMGCSSAWWCAGAAGVFVVAAWLHLRFWTRRLTRSVSYDETLRIATPDGSAFELRRLRGAAGSLPPVVIVHGIAMNHRNLDPDADLSLARDLHAAGRDVWLLTLRCGRQDLSWRERRACRFEALARYDVPGAVATVLARTGAQQVDYVGFSMGGILLYAALGRSLPRAQVRRAVTIGSPAQIARLISGVGWLRHLPQRWMPGLPLRTLSRMTAFASEWLETFIHRPLLQLANATPGYVRHTAVDAVMSVPGPLVHDLIRWGWGDGAIRLDDGKDILQALQHVDVPVRFFAGAADGLAGPRAVARAYAAWGAATTVDKQLILLGKQAGHGADYGHGDLAIGVRARADVFAPVCAFLAEPSP